MKYTAEIVVDVSLEEFIRKLDNVENLKHWQRDIISSEHLSGQPGQYGAKMKMTYKMGKRNLELIETIEENAFPNKFIARYSAKGMYNIQENHFIKLSEERTKWISHNEFIPLNLTMRLFMLLMPGAFKKQSKQYMLDFKNFVENGTSVASV